MMQTSQISHNVAPLRCCLHSSHSDRSNGSSDGNFRRRVTFKNIEIIQLLPQDQKVSSSTAAPFDESTPSRSQVIAAGATDADATAQVSATVLSSKKTLLNIEFVETYRMISKMKQDMRMMKQDEDEEAYEDDVKNNEPTKNSKCRRSRKDIVIMDKYYDCDIPCDKTSSRISLDENIATLHHSRQTTTSTRNSSRNFHRHQRRIQLPTGSSSRSVSPRPRRGRGRCWNPENTESTQSLSPIPGRSYIDLQQQQHEDEKEQAQ